MGRKKHNSDFDTEELGAFVDKDQEEYDDLMSDLGVMVKKTSIDDQINAPVAELSKHYPYKTKLDINQNEVLILIRALTIRVYSDSKNKEINATKYMLGIHSDFGKVYAAVLWSCIKNLHTAGYDSSFYSKNINNIISEIHKSYKVTYIGGGGYKSDETEPLPDELM